MTRGAAREVVEHNYQRWDRHEGDGDTAVAALSGIEAETRVVHLWRVEDGLVKVCSVYETKEAALQAAGLPELPEAS